MGKQLSAKDKAFEKERVKYRQTINQLKREISDKNNEIISLKDRVLELEELLRQKEDHVTRLLEYTELSEDEMKKVINTEKTKAESVALLQYIAGVFNIF